jgi:hypothetical protein
MQWYRVSASLTYRAKSRRATFEHMFPDVTPLDYTKHTDRLIIKQHHS